MKITHLSFVSTFSDGYSYQENILPLYHKKLGHEVSVITSQQVYNEEGELCFTGKTEYLNEYGIPVLRLKYKKPVKTKKISKIRDFFIILIIKSIVILQLVHYRHDERQA